MLALPVDEAAAGAFLSQLEDGTASAEAVQQFGALLFKALFQGRIKELYIAVRARLGKAFRYRLVLDAPAVARLPWELLYDPERGAFLALETSLVRAFGLAEPTQALEVQPPLRILISAAFPKDLPAVAGQEEIDSILRELAELVQRKDAEVVPLAHASLRALQNTLREAAARDQPFHVLHFIGHGWLDRKAGRSQIFFEDDQNAAEPVGPAALADILRPFDLKLVYLNGCETAALSAFDQGFAPALMALGIPAVIGVQVAVWDRVARQMAQDFYAALADSQPVDQALLSARQLARSEPLHEAGVAIPVCYLRTASGQIVNLVRAGAPPLTRATWPAWLRAQATPRRLGQGLLGLIGLVSALLGIYWGIVAFGEGAKPTPVPQMRGDYNIAVAAFQARDADGNAVKTDKGVDLADELAGQIAGDIQVLSAEDIEFQLLRPAQVGFVDGASDGERAASAQRLADTLNADLLLYGNLVVERDHTSLIPRLYVSEGRLGYAPELAGHHQVSDPIEVADSIESNPVAPKLLREKLAQHAVGLAKFVVGQGYFRLDDLPQAARWFEDGYASSSDNQIRRVILLFLGSTAAMQNDLPTARVFYQRALEVDPEYARAELGRSQVQFLEAKDNCRPGQVDDQAIAGAIEGYQRALLMDSQPFDEIRTKANLYLGYAYLCRWLAAPTDGQEEALALRDRARDAFRYVVDRYQQTNDPAIRYLAEAAWQSLGGMYATMSEKGRDRDLAAQAEDAYRQAVALGRPSSELAISHLLLAQVHGWRRECQAATGEMDQAAAIYQNVTAANPRLRNQNYEDLRTQVEAMLAQSCPS